jgi:hypothetical protein
MDHCTPFVDLSSDVYQRCPLCGFSLQAHVASRIAPEDVLIELPLPDGTLSLLTQQAESGDV